MLKSPGVGQRRGAIGAPLPSTPAPSAIEAIFRRDRWVTICGVFLLTALSWLYLIGLTLDMPASDSTMSAQIRPWAPRDFLFMFSMWAVMMVAMMMPSASPMILLHVRMNRQQGDGRGGVGGTATFVAGYLLAWTGFSLVATLLQWGLERLALLSPMMASSSPLLGAGLLLVAGIYQLTPAKDACLKHCRSPVQFLMQHWRPGAGGAFKMGLAHGIYCIGCCWLLMTLLFVGGVMNLLWIAALAGLVLLEKVVPRGEWLARAAGAGLIVAGLVVASEAV